MSEFEERSRATFDDSVGRIDGRVRSRLTQARHAALDELATRQRQPAQGWRSAFSLRTLVPAGGMAAVALVAVLLWSGRGPGGNPALPPVVADAASSIEDLDLLADHDALSLGADDDPEFYEWAAAQADMAASETRGS